MCSSSASGARIGVFFESNATGTTACIEQNTSFTFYVFAIFEADVPQQGVASAEYRVTGTDPLWVTTVTPNPSSNVSIGSPIDGVGTNIAWPTCQRPQSRVLLLHTISGFNPAAPTARTLRVEHRNPPASPDWPCPRLISSCDAKDVSLCATGGEAFVNYPEHCAVGAELHTWTRVKSLFSH